MKFTIKEIAQAVGGKVIHDSQQLVTQVEFDSRKIEEGSLFVPLAGARDGHDFIAQAIESGAVATLWAQPVEEAPVNIAVIQVTDVLVAMQKLASYYLAQVQPKVIAITGSNGKTTTKDMTAAVLAEKYETYKTQGNYNNNIGMPYTILHMPITTEMLVLEMGMDHAGEIAELSTLAQPDAAIITIIGEAHIENLGSRLGIAQAKMEITTGLKNAGVLLVPKEPLLTPLLVDLPQQIIEYSLEVDSQLTGTVIKSEKEATYFKTNQDELTYMIPVPGSYNVKNALAAYGIGRFFEVSPSDIQQGLAQFKLTQNRTQWLTAKNGADMLSDVYNANPTAMGLVLDTVAQLPTKGRRIAVLADMLELGPDSNAMHASMVNHLETVDFPEVYLYGEAMLALKATLEKQQPQTQVYWYAANEKTALIQALQKNIAPDDTLIFKGSNGMGLLEVVESLI